MSDKTNVITVTQANLDWINTNVPGKSKQARLEAMLLFYQTHGGPVNAAAPAKTTEATS